MTDTSPTDVIEEVAAGLGAGDLERVISLYEPDATFAPQPGQSIHGAGAIREALAAFIALQPRMTGEIEKVLVAGDTALVCNRWTLRGQQPDGKAVELGGTSADVLRRGEDGRWRILIDDPWGSGG
jgi:uncharacterized protein (TIGR02246 family)